MLFRSLVGLRLAHRDSGRRLVARLDVEADTVFRPGDFVTVTVREASLANVADIPATAATEDGKLLVLDENGVLAEVSAVIERRQDNRLLVSGVPFGAQVVAERLPQLGAGVTVRAAEPKAPSEGAIFISGRQPVPTYRNAYAEPELSPASLSRATSLSNIRSSIG